MTELAEKNPSNASWQRLLAVAHNHVGVALQSQGDLAQALTEFRAQLTILVELAAKDAANAYWQRELVFGHLTRRRHLREKRRFGGRDTRASDRRRGREKSHRKNAF